MRNPNFSDLSPNLSDHFNSFRINTSLHTKSRLYAIQRANTELYYISFVQSNTRETRKTSIAEKYRRVEDGVTRRARDSLEWGTVKHELHRGTSHDNDERSRTNAPGTIAFPKQHAD